MRRCFVLLLALLVLVSASQEIAPVDSSLDGISHDDLVQLSAAFDLGGFIDKASDVVHKFGEVAKVGDVVKGVKSLFSKDRSDGTHPLVGLIGAVTCSPTATGEGYLRASWAWLGNVGKGQSNTGAKDAYCQQELDKQKAAEEAARGTEDKKLLDAWEKDLDRDQYYFGDWHQRHMVHGLAHHLGHIPGYGEIDQKSIDEELKRMREEEEDDEDNEKLAEEKRKVAEQKRQAEQMLDKIEEQREELRKERAKFEADKLAWTAEKCATAEVSKLNSNVAGAKVFDADFVHPVAPNAFSGLESEDAFDNPLANPMATVSRIMDVSGAGAHLHSLLHHGPGKKGAYPLDPSDAFGGDDDDDEDDEDELHHTAMGVVKHMREQFGAKMLAKERLDAARYQQQLHDIHKQRLEEEVAQQARDLRKLDKFRGILARAAARHPPHHPLAGHQLRSKKMFLLNADAECEIGAWDDVKALVESGKVLAKETHFDPAGRGDHASALENIFDAAEGKRARRSRHAKAPGGEVCLDPHLADLIVVLAKHLGRIEINSLSGGSHSWDVSHYEGRAVDIGAVDGRKLDMSHGKLAMAVVRLCRENGAIVVRSAAMTGCAECEKYTEWVHCAY